MADTTSVTVFRRFFNNPDTTASSSVAWSRSFDVVEVEETTLETEVTDNPVESGVSISDHAFDRPIKLTITAAVSDVPRFSRPGQDEISDDEPDYFLTGDTSRSVAAYAWLKQMRAAHEPFSVQTGLDLYPSMLLTSLRVKQDKDSSRVLRFTAELREITYVFTQTVLYPAKEAKTKRAVAKKKDDGNQESKEPTLAEASKASKSMAKSLSDALLGMSTR